MAEKAKLYAPGKDSDKDMLDLIETLSSNFIVQLKFTVKTVKKLNKALKNCKAINKDLMKDLFQADVLKRKQEKVIDSSYYMTLKNLDTARNYQRHAYIKLSQLPDMEQVNKIISDSIEYINYSFTYIVRALKSLRGVTKKR